MKEHKKVIKAVHSLIQRFALQMDADFDDIEEYDFLYIYSFADMFINYHEMCTAIEHDLTFHQFHDWYWNYWHVNGRRINLKNYIIIKKINKK